MGEVDNIMDEVVEHSTKNTKEKKRELYISLFFSGGSPEIATKYNPLFSLKEYLKASKSQSYKDFVEQINKEFLENSDLMLLGNLYRIQEVLATMDVTDKNYPQIMKNYNEMLKITQPIVERLSKQKIEASTFQGLELIIKNPDDQKHLQIKKDSDEHVFVS